MTKKRKDTDVKKYWTRVFKLSLLNATKNNLFYFRENDMVLKIHPQVK